MSGPETQVRMNRKNRPACLGLRGAMRDPDGRVPEEVAQKLAPRVSRRSDDRRFDFHGRLSLEIIMIHLPEGKINRTCAEGWWLRPGIPGLEVGREFPQAGLPGTPRTSWSSRGPRGRKHRGPG